MRLPDIRAGMQLDGVSAERSVVVIGVEPFGAAVNLTFRTPDGVTTSRLLYPKDEAAIRVAAAAGRRFDADPAEYRMALEAKRIELAGHFDPMLAVHTSDVQPLPHQIRAVYGEMIGRTPLRFLLADDPGAGKTIMAGLYIKELMLRGDVHRALVVAPGGLVEQWQDELLLKFSLRFDILTNDMIGATADGSAFEHHPLLIARMDHLARNPLLMDQLRDSEWDLAIVDEAHRMSANYFGAELKLTKRFALGQLLGERSRHFLLMTATPHNGKEEDYQQFLTLLDRDGFEGKYRKGMAKADTAGLMRRMLKEELLTFEGRKLFPERVAETVPYRLSPLEQTLYEAVTEYVRDEMNRAERLDGRRRNTVGFALTVLQRRLASSPEAILRSLERRAKRLEQRLAELDQPAASRGVDALLDTSVELLADDEEFSSDEIERMEDEVVDAASAAQTRAEIEHEIGVVRRLVALAARVRAAGDDRKWVELREILESEALRPGHDGRARKLIVFTEHRDTLDYLLRQVQNLFGRADAVVAIHGGVARPLRRQITTEFTGNPQVQVLLATDAAGEGLNLQAAHLMVNYDLPWNPNRIDQRFGRIHRIGQREVCRLWNLVSVDTREGQVYERLLHKLAEQHGAYGGKVFEVLGQGFKERSLRELLLDAIRYGDDPIRRAEMDRIIDASVGENVAALIDAEAMAHETIGPIELERLRREMEEARSRRLQPHFVELFFRDAFKRLGGRLGRREPGRFEIGNVPARLRAGAPALARPIATRYGRVCFDPARLAPDGLGRAELLAPGHPLFDAVVDATLDDLAPALDAGATFSAELDTPQVLVASLLQVADATGDRVAQEFGFSFVGSDGTAVDAGPAPHLDLIAAPAPRDAAPVAPPPWAADAERAAVAWAVGEGVPALVERTERRVLPQLDRARARVHQRLTAESDRLFAESLAVSQAAADGKPTKQSPDAMIRRAEELLARRDVRLRELDARGRLRPAMPRVLTAALVLPADIDTAADTDTVADTAAAAAPTGADPFARKEVERRAVDLVLASERALGRDPQEMPPNNKGYDVRVVIDGVTTYLEVKGRIGGADDVRVTVSEVLHGKNNPGQHVLALVAVSPDGPAHDEVRYLRDEFLGVDLAGMETAAITLDWAKTWAKGHPPS